MPHLVTYTGIGLVASRRDDIESAPYGGFEKILDEEVREHFLSINGVAAVMEVHETTAWRWLAQSEPRYIEKDRQKLYLREDVLVVKGRRAASKESKRKVAA